MKKENVAYEAPELTVVEVEVEKGFAQTAKDIENLSNLKRESW